MNRQSELLYAYVSSLCKTNSLITFCIENYKDADSNSFYFREIPLGIGLLKKQLNSKNEDLIDDFISLLKTSPYDSIGNFQNFLLDTVDQEYRDELLDRLSPCFQELQKKPCDSYLFCDIMTLFRQFEEEKLLNGYRDVEQSHEE